MIDTTNNFLVGLLGNKVVIQRNVGWRALTKQEALNLAAWLVVLADDYFWEVDSEWRKTLEAVLNT